MILPDGRLCLVLLAGAAFTTAQAQGVDTLEIGRTYTAQVSTDQPYAFAVRPAAGGMVNWQVSSGIDVIATLHLPEGRQLVTDAVAEGTEQVLWLAPTDDWVLIEVAVFQPSSGRVLIEGSPEIPTLVPGEVHEWQITAAHPVSFVVPPSSDAVNWAFTSEYDISATLISTEGWQRTIDDVVDGTERLVWQPDDSARYIIRLDVLGSGVATVHARNTDILETAEDSVAMLQSLNDRAVQLFHSGGYLQARRLSERALAIRETMLGPEHPDVANSLNNLAVLHDILGDYGEARPLYERALAIRETMLGPDHPDVANTLNNLAVLLSRTADYVEARPLYERALAIREATLGPDHPDVAVSLDNLAVLLADTGYYAEARPLYERALAIREAVLGPDNPAVAHSLNNLAVLLANTGDYDSARPLHERALAIREAVLGPDHPEVAVSLGNLAGVFHSSGDYAGARPLYERALAIREAAYGADHPEVAVSLNDLADLLDIMGHFAEARPLHERALAIREAALGPDHPDVAISLNYLAHSLANTGDYAEARPLYERALAIKERVLGSDHPEVAVSLGNLASLLVAVGEYAEARPLQERALAIRETALGPDHPAVATALDALAGLLFDTGDYAGARPLYDRALAIREAALGPDHPYIAVSLNNLALLLDTIGNYAEARPLYERALAIQSTALGPDHPDVAVSLNNFAGHLATTTGDFVLVLRMLERALEIREKLLGPDHPEVAFSMRNLAVKLAGMGREAEARPYFERARVIYEGAFGPDSPEVARSLILAPTEDAETSMQELDRAVSILESRLIYPEWLITGYSKRALLHYRAGDRVRAFSDLEEALFLAERQRAAVGASDDTRARYFGDYASLFDRMVGWQIEAGDVESALEFAERGRSRVLLDQLAAAQVDLRSSIPDELRTPLEDREKTAALRIASLRRRLVMVRERSDLGSGDRRALEASYEDSLATAQGLYSRVYDEIRAASPLWQSYVTTGGEPVRLATAQRELVPGKGAILYYQLGDEGSFLVLVPPPGGRPVAYPLEVSDSLAGALGIAAGRLTGQTLHALIAGSKDGESEGVARDLATRGFVVPDSVPRGLLASLFRALVPKEAWDEISRMEEVVIVPDGALFMLPFEALLVSGEEYWLDQGPVIRYAPSLTALHNISRRPAVGRNRGTLSLSDPLFTLSELEDEADLREDQAPTRSESTSLETFRRGFGALRRLPGTERETEALAAAYGESAPEYLVVLSRDEATELNVRQRIVGRKFLHFATHGLTDERRGSLFGALAMTPSPDGASFENDGFLHLNEIYDLQLDGVELAVLSACATNVGSSVEGEGVFSLTRGFLAAGARRVISSQWAVDDASTAILVGALYGEVIAAERRGQIVDYAGFLWQAKKRLRASTQWRDPYYWAPFVLTGVR